MIASWVVCFSIVLFVYTLPVVLAGVGVPYLCLF